MAIYSDQSLQWMISLSVNVQRFLAVMKSSEQVGFYRYAHSGDRYGDTVEWGVANAVFAAKLYYMISEEHSDDAQAIVPFLQQFQKKNGLFCDSLLARASRMNRIKRVIRERDLSRFSMKRVYRSETRQAYAALACLGAQPQWPYRDIPTSRETVDVYLTRLDWRHPWEAGGHFSHLVFFLKYNRDFFGVGNPEVDSLIQYALQWVSQKQSSDDGAWYDDGASTIEKVNGAMKVISGYDAVARSDFGHPEKLIDLCLAVSHDSDGCNNYDLVYVLYHCLKRTDHRRGEIEDFCVKMLTHIRAHYYPEIGGFSFYPHRAKDVYNGAHISKGKDEPDIHGTVLFMIAITLITKILRISDVDFHIPLS